MENLNQKYSICLIPPDVIIEQVKEYKDFLAAHIGSYKSRNSKAHITIKEIFANDRELQLTISQIKRCCEALTPIRVQCNQFGAYPTNKTLFIEPNESSKKDLIEIMKKVQKATTIKSVHSSTDPHISIGRGILKFEQALTLLNFSLNMDFEINAVAIRKFNPNLKQYEVFEFIPFLSQESKEEKQLSLF